MEIKFLKANNGDSILISFCDNENEPRNILIDGGMPQTYYKSGTNSTGELFHTIQDIRNNFQKIDLLIMTHIDEDHIGGILKWFESDEDASKLIEKVWFNSGKTIAKYINAKENEDLEITLNVHSSTNTSVLQGKKFEDYIDQNNIWDKEIIKFDEVINYKGVKIQILSPNDILLEKLLKEFKKPSNNYFTSKGKKDWENDILNFINEEEKEDYKFIGDDKVSNGSSIAFLLTFKEKNFLFLGDSFPETIINSLNKLGFNKESKLTVELMKVSHHGSSKNTNKELLEIINTSNYLISTSSESHNHPDKRTLSRILHNTPNATIYFNYDEVLNNIFSAKDFEDFTNLYAKNASEYKIEWE